MLRPARGSSHILRCDVGSRLDILDNSILLASYSNSVGCSIGTANLASPVISIRRPQLGPRVHLLGPQSARTKSNIREVSLIDCVSMLQKKATRSHKHENQTFCTPRRRCYEYRINAARSARGWGTGDPRVGPETIRTPLAS